MPLLRNLLLVLLISLSVACSNDKRGMGVNMQINDIVMAGNIDLLKEAYNDSKHRSYRDNQGYTLLMLAVDAGSVECAQYLLDRQHSPNDRLDNGISALWIAVSAGHEKIAEILINHGADINANGDTDAITPLMVAVSSSDKEMITMLIGRGADKGIKDKHGQSVKSYTSDPEILKLLQ
jgi:uncharacterized protein